MALGRQAAQGGVPIGEPSPAVAEKPAAIATTSSAGPSPALDRRIGEPAGTTATSPARRTSPSSASRARLLALSPRGAGALAAARSFHRRYERRLARRHGPETVTAMRALLTEMAGAGHGGDLDPQLRAMYL